MGRWTFYSNQRGPEMKGTHVISHRGGFWLGTLLIVLGMLVGSGTVWAKKVPKVEICHFDADTGLYKKLSVSGNAVEKTHR